MNYALELWCWKRLGLQESLGLHGDQSILKEISPEYLLGRTDAEAETPIFWPPDGKSQLIGKDPDAGEN